MKSLDSLSLHKRLIPLIEAITVFPVPGTARRRKTTTPPSLQLLKVSVPP